MKNTLKKILAVGMTLALVSSFAAAIPVSAAPGCNDWDDIPMPVRAEGTEVGVMDIAPDGTMFLAFYDEVDLEWDIKYSTDGGFNWKNTNLTGIADTNPNDIYGFAADQGATPVRILVSPMWPDNKNVYVALSNGEVWRLPNAGLGTPAPMRSIVSDSGASLEEEDLGLWDMDIWADGTYNYLTVATDMDVFVIKDALFEVWIDYELNVTTADEGAYNETGRHAVEVRFAPDFGTSELIWAVVSDSDEGGEFILTSADAPTRWGYVYEEIGFEQYDNDMEMWTPFVDMEFDPAYSAAYPQLYVAVAQPWWNGYNMGNNGNLYYASGQSSTTGPGDMLSNYIFFEDRPLGTVEVSGGVIMVQDSETGEVYITEDAGSTWDEAFRSPAAFYWGQLYMSPDFDDDDTVFSTVMDGGVNGVSGLYRSIDGGYYWDGISLLDMEIDEIVDLAFDPKGGSQPVLMLVEYDGATYIFYTPDATAASPQWLLKDNSANFLQGGDELDGITMISWDEAGDTVMFMGMEAGEYYVYRSTNDGNSFSYWRGVPVGTIGDPMDWVVVDGTTISVVGTEGYWGTRPIGTAISKDLAFTAGLTIARDGDTIAIGTEDGDVYASTDAGSTWKNADIYGSGNDVYVAFGPDGKLYAAGDGGAVKSIAIGTSLIATNVVAEQNGAAVATAFSGIWASPDNTLYAMGTPGGVTSGFQIDELVGTITLGAVEGVAATYDTSSPKIELTGISGGNFTDGEDLLVYAADVKAASSSMASGTIWVQGATSGAMGYVDINVFDADNPFNMFGVWPADLSVTFDGVIVAADESEGPGQTMFRLLLGEQDNIWENKPQSGASGLWGTTGSNILWTLVDTDTIYAFEDFNSGMVQGVDVEEIDKNPNSATKTLEVSWTALACTSCYEIYVDGEYYTSVTKLDGAGYYAAGTTLNTKLENMDYATEYEVQVRACDGGPLQSRLSAVAGETTECYVVAPTPQVPVQGMQDASLAPSFVWELPADGCAPASYEFQLSTDPAFGSTIVSTTTTNTGYTYEARDLDYDTNHYWRVRSVGSDGVKSAWTTIQNFHTMVEPQDPVEITQTSVPAPTLTYTQPADQTITVSVPPAVTLTQTVTSVPTPTITLPDQPTPAYIWVIVAVGAILTIAVIVLIIRTRRAE